MAKPKTKRKHNVIRFPGGSIGYTQGAVPATASLAKALAQGMKASQKEAEAKAAALADRPPPNLTLQPYVVAFIDILGFRREIEKAKTVEDLQGVHSMIRTVQEAFQHPSSTNSSEDQTELNRAYGRRVIALSDAVVVAITPRCEMTSMMGAYDVLGLAILDLLSAQAYCVSKGIFLRGGVSHGPFCYENDILLSPAMARAYELESNCAEYPVIVVPDSTRLAIFGVPKKGSYASGADPTPGYFVRHDRAWTRNDPNWKGEDLYYLDYLSVVRDDTDIGWQGDDYKKYRAAKEADNGKRAQALFDRRILKSVAYGFRMHKNRLIAAYNANPDERVRKKYRWLMEYHNRSFRHDLPHVRKEIIDLGRFQPGSGVD